LQILREGAGTQFDAALVEVFVQLVVAQRLAIR
jgi:HD-GYP domain-containing protein (c-di-GMP phosphodiesterase class II)